MYNYFYSCINGVSTIQTNVVFLNMSLNPVSQTNAVIKMAQIYTYYPNASTVAFLNNQTPSMILKLKG